MPPANLGSYPPESCHGRNAARNVDRDDTIQQKMQDFDPVTVLDLQCLDLDKLGEVCKDWGLFRLVNLAKKLLSLSFESKQALLTSPISCFQSTFSSVSCSDQMLDTFRVLLEEYGGHLARLATTMFGAMAKNLHLDPELSKTYISESTGFVRVYRYPQCSMENEAWGINVHTDSSVLSILNQDQVGGLQVLKDDNWLQVKPIPDTLVFNLGDMMQAISDDKYKSVKHRVKVNKEKERFSICYFVFPAEGSVIQSSKYRPFTYSDFQAQVQQDVKTLGFKVGLERFKVAG
eukprot:XP_024449572.1 gibberellin 2-beta-dioxygenase 8 isoform X2 [Populus trichocarpa]